MRRVTSIFVAFIFFGLSFMPLPVQTQESMTAHKTAKSKDLSSFTQDLSQGIHLELPFNMTRFANVKSADIKTPLLVKDLFSFAKDFCQGIYLELPSPMTQFTDSILFVPHEGTASVLVNF